MEEMLAALEPVAPVKPVAGYLGGKRHLAKRIIERIDAVPHSLYVEPFVGMGGIFFRRSRRPKVEVINDISADVTTLFRLLQRHYQQLLDTLKWQITSRAEFKRLVKVDPSTLTDLERAARFIYLQRLAFGSKIIGRNFGVDANSSARFDLTKLVPMLEDVHERLAPVTIEQLPFDQLIRRYDRPGALFYCDPPYWGNEGDYGPVFSNDNFRSLRDLLRAAQGRVILSLNDRPEVREMFGEGFQLEPVELSYGVGGGQKLARELIITR